MNTDGHLTAEEVEALGQPTGALGGLPVSERLAISDHLAQCAACRVLVAATAGVPADDHRSRLATEMQAFIADAQREVRDEEEDLQAFASFLTAFPEECFEPGGTLPTPVTARPSRRSAVGDTHTTAPSIRWWTGLFSSPAFVAAGVAGLVTLAFFKGKSLERSPTVRSTPLLEDGPVVVTADGRLHTSVNLPEDLRLAMAAAIAQHSLHLAAGTVGTLRGEEALPTTEAGAVPAVAPPFPVVPTPGATVENERPLLQWTSVPGSAGYQVEITLPATGKTIFSPPLPAAQTSWQPGITLERGRIYHWRVLTTAQPGTLPVLADRPAPSSFKVLGAVEEQGLNQLRTGSEVSHLALAIAYARLELRSEAKQELMMLRTKNLYSPMAEELLDSLK